MQKLKDLALAAGPIGANNGCFVAHDGEMWHPVWFRGMFPGQLRFPTEASALAAIKELGFELDVLL